MIVDDEVSILRSLERLLRKEQYSIITFDSPVKALEYVKKNPVSVVISDQRMPDMEGVTLLKNIRDVSPDTIRILLTGYADMEAVIRAINEGQVYRFISKPWNDEELKIVIRHALENLDLILDNKILLKMVKNQKDIISEIEAKFPDIATLPKIKDGAYVIEDTNENLEDFMKKYFPESK